MAGGYQPAGLSGLPCCLSERDSGAGGGPGFATRTRASLLYWLLKQGSVADALWLPKFALRSQVALAGLAVLYPDREVGADLNRRVLKVFQHNALWPLAVWPEIEQVCQLLAMAETPRKAFSDAGSVGPIGGQQHSGIL